MILLIAQIEYQSSGIIVSYGDIAIYLTQVNPLTDPEVTGQEKDGH